MKSIVEQVFLYAENHPDKIALTDGKRNLSYRELCCRTVAARQLLAETYALKKGDAVILAANKQLSFVAVYFACHLLGAIVLPLAPDTNEDRLKIIADTSRPRLAVGLDAACLICAKADLTAFDTAADSYDLASVTFPEMDATADILFTTGTTGLPKGVVLSQKNIAAAANNINTFVQNEPEDIEMLALPISHSFGLGRLRCALSNGQTVVILGSFANVKRFFRFMQEYRVTGFGMVPASWALLKKLSGLTIGEFAGQLHYIEIGSAPMPLADKRLLMELLPNTRICMHYGLTEASRSAFIEFHSEQDRLDSVGKASPHMEIEIRDESGASLPDGAEGELCVRGGAVTPGYYKLPEVNAVSYWGDFFRTGDWGVKDAQGYLYLRSRKKELINVGAKKVAPLEVEAPLLQLDFITDCACVGIPDPDGILGEAVKAYVVTDQPERVQKDALNKYLAARLEDYKLPVEYEVIDAIPKTASGKVQRLALKGR